MRKIGLYGQSMQTENISYLIRFLEYMDKHSIEVHIEQLFLKTLKGFEELKTLDRPSFSEGKTLDKDFQFVFTFGGDGTILSSLTFVRDSSIPIVGINTGNLGFLATFNKNVFIEKLDHILEQKLTPIARSLLWIESDEEVFKKKCMPFALNEIALLRKETTAMITIEAYINEEFLTSYWADGLILSTPTGSTGYSLSCGGPIIIPENKNFVLTPIAPHNLFTRPLIIPDDKYIQLKVHSRSQEYSLSLDTRIQSLKTQTKLIIKKAPFNIYIIQDDGQTYYKTLREKLLWGANQRN